MPLKHAPLRALRAVAVLAAACGLAAAVPAELSGAGERGALGSLVAPAGFSVGRGGRLLAVWGGYRFRLGGSVLAVSSSGASALAGDGEGAIRLWDLKTGMQTRLLRGSQALVRCAAFAPGDALAATGGADGTAVLWNLESGEERPLAGRHRGEVLSLAFLDGGARLATGGEDGAIRIWRVRDGKLLRTLRGHRGWVTAFGEVSGNRLVSADERGAVLAWRLEGAGSPAVAVEPQQDLAAGVGTLVTRGAALAFADDDGRVRYLDLDAGTRVMLPVVLSRVHALSLRQDTLLVAGTRTGADGQAEFWLGRWLPASGEVSTLAGRPDDGTRAAAFPPGGASLLISDGAGFHLWSTEPPAEMLSSDGHAAAVRSLAVSPDGTVVVSTAGDGTARGWSVAEGRELFVARGFAGDVKAAAFSRDGLSVLAGDVAGRQVQIDPRTGAVLRTLGQHRGLQTLGFSSGGATSVSASYERMAGWNLETGAASGTSWFGGGASSVALSANGERALVAAGSEIQLRSVATGEVLEKLERPDGRLAALALSVDGTRAAIAWAPSGRQRTATVELWGPAFRKPTRRLVRTKGTTTALAFSQDAGALLIAGSDGAVRLSDTRSGALLFEASLAGNAERPTAVAFLPEGSGFVVGTSLGAILRFATGDAPADARAPMQRKREGSDGD